MRLAVNHQEATTERALLVLRQLRSVSSGLMLTKQFFLQTRYGTNWRATLQIGLLPYSSLHNAVCISVTPRVSFKHLYCQHCSTIYWPGSLDNVNIRNIHHLILYVITQRLIMITQLLTWTNTACNRGTSQLRCLPQHNVSAFMQLHQYNLLQTYWHLTVVLSLLLLH